MTQTTAQQLKWSYSAYKQFDNCPRQYHHVRILKDTVQPDTEPLLYGKRVHSALEDFWRHGVPLPSYLSHLGDLMDVLNKVEGERLVEHQMGVTEMLQPCVFSAHDVWWRGIADLLIVNEEKRKGWLVDWKTSKSTRYADVSQLKLLAAAAFIHYPFLESIRSALVFVSIDDVVSHDISRERGLLEWDYWKNETKRIETAMETNIWNPKSSPLCKFCPVSDRDCEYKTR